MHVIKLSEFMYFTYTPKPSAAAVESTTPRGALSRDTSIASQDEE